MRGLSTIPARSRPIPVTSLRGARTHGWSVGRLTRHVTRCEPDVSGFGERWLTKRELAAYLRVTPRWIELQQPLGLPVLRLGSVNRYRISEVEVWLRQHYPSTPAIAGRL